MGTTEKTFEMSAEDKAHLDRFNRAVDRVGSMGLIAEETIIAILNAYFDKKMSVEDLADVFCMPQVAINLLIADYDKWDGC